MIYNKNVIYIYIMKKLKKLFKNQNRLKFKTLEQSKYIVLEFYNSFISKYI